MVSCSLFKFNLNFTKQMLDITLEYLHYPRICFYYFTPTNVIFLDITLYLSKMLHFNAKNAYLIF